MVALALQYTLFVFVAAFAIIQIAASHAGLNGLLVLPSRRTASIFGYMLIAGSFFWFFGLVDRNVRGLEGMEQALLFVPSAVFAVFVTILLSSIVHERRPSRLLRLPRPSWRHRRRPLGLEALREMSYLDAVLGERHKRERAVR